jgi:glycosyltransferase 2 family protein
VVRNPVRRWIWVAIVVVIGIAAILMLEDVRDLGERLDGFAWGAFVLACGLAIANYAIRFVRWQLYLKHQQIVVPLGSSALVFGAGLSLSITPAKLGELIKSYLLRELHHVPATRTAPIVVAERVTDLAALLLIALVGVAAYGLPATVVIAGTTLIVVGLLLLTVPAPALALIDGVTTPLWMRRFRTPIRKMYEELAGLCSPGLLMTSTVLGVAAWGCECIGFAAVVNAFPEVHIDLGIAAVIYAVTTIAGALSFLPGGLGVTEGAMTLLLVQHAVHIDRATAIDATLLTRVATLWLALVLGLVFLAAAKARIKRARRE